MSTGSKPYSPAQDYAILASSRPFSAVPSRCCWMRRRSSPNSPVRSGVAKLRRSSRLTMASSFGSVAAVVPMCSRALRRRRQRRRGDDFVHQTHQTRVVRSE